MLRTVFNLLQTDIVQMDIDTHAHTHREREGESDTFIPFIHSNRNGCAQIRESQQKMAKNDIRKWMKYTHTHTHSQRNEYTVYVHVFCNVQFERYMRRWHWYIWMRVNEFLCVCLFMSNHYDGVRCSALKLSTAHLFWSNDFAMIRLCTVNLILCLHEN